MVSAHTSIINSKAYMRPKFSSLWIPSSNTIKSQNLGLQNYVLALYLYSFGKSAVVGHCWKYSIYRHVITTSRTFFLVKHCLIFFSSILLLKINTRGKLVILQFITMLVCDFQKANSGKEFITAQMW